MIKVLAVAAIFLSPLVLSDCDRETVYAKVCVQGTKSHANGVDFYRRLADTDCKSGKAGSRWRFYDGGVHVPKVGGRAAVKSGTFTEPSGSVVYIPESGGTANKVADSE